LLAGLLALLGTVQFLALRQSLIEADVELLHQDFTTAYDPLVRQNASRPSPTPTPRPTATARPSGASASPSPSATPKPPPPGAALRTALLSQAFATELSSKRISILLLNSDGGFRAKAPDNREIPTLPVGEYLRAVAGRAQPRYLVPSETRPGHTYLVVLERLPQPRQAGLTGVVGLAQLSLPTDEMELVLAHDRFLYLIGSVGVLLLALILSPLVTARALRPLEHMGQTAAALAGGDYKQRVNLPGRADEVGKLARAFDDMADRIDKAFEVRRQSEERMRQFVSDASHELRTPLTAISGYLDVMLRRSELDPATVQSSLGAMQRESARMTRLVNDLLQLTRLEGGGKLRRDPVALDALVNQTLDEMALAGPVERRLEPVRVLGDADALKRVVVNLAQNAVKYAPGSLQEWTCSSANGTATLRLRDHGPGIAPSDLPRVFERFYRGEKMRGRDQGGSGLGLAIVKSIVEAHGGKVDAQSVVGDGATFTVTLPVPAKDEEITRA
jgi:signal transduction histidine kinase